MDTTITKPIYTLMLALAFAFGLSACNTMEGAGRDIEKAGETIEDKARENK
jgi:predicted small secreted protein